MKVFHPPHGKWKYELDFQFMHDADDADPVEVAKKAAAEIRKLLPQVKDEDLRYELQGIAEAFEETVDSDETYNSCMDELYDVADRERIWVKTF